MSLGINLLPVTKKLCNFNCIYCEYGLTGQTDQSANNLHLRKEVYYELEKRLFEIINKNNK